MKKYKIALCGTYYMESVGDSLLYNCVKYLYSNESNKQNIDLEFNLVDLNERNSFEDLNNGSISYKWQRIKSILLKIIHLNKQYRLSEDVSYYKRAFAESNLIIVFGGGLFKYDVNRDYTKVFTCLNKAAYELNIPVVYNAIGIEGKHVENSNEFIKLKNAFLKGVNIFSVRDNYDIANLYFQNTNIDYRLVGDTGIFVNRAFKTNAQEDKLVGLNPVGALHFRPYFGSVDESKIFELWINVATYLLDHGYRVFLFTNGDSHDEKLSNRIHEYFAKKNIFLEKENAKSAEQMVNNISRCRFVIASRLHTCITAYSLNIPAIGLAWNQKLLHWAEAIGASNMFFDYYSFDQIAIINQFEQATKEFHYNKKIRERLEVSLHELAHDAIDLMLSNEC